MGQDGNNSGSSSQLFAFHEERILQAEDRISNLEADLKTQVKVDDLQFSGLSRQITSLGETLGAKIDNVAADVGELKKRSDFQSDAISKLKVKDTKRSRRAETLKRLALRLLWAAPVAALAEAGHQLYIRFSAR